MSGVRTVAKTLGPTFMKFMEDTGLGDDRVVLQTLCIGSHYSEGVKCNERC